MNAVNINFPYWYYAGCFNVVDGDTYDLQLDYGFSIWGKDRFRAYGINTPEMHSTDTVQRDLAMKAKSYAINAILGKTIEAKNLIVNTHLDKKDKYGRPLADIFYLTTDRGWCNLNDELIQAGLAVVYMV